MLERRAHRRFACTYPATLRARGAVHAVALTDLSLGGAQLALCAETEQQLAPYYRDHAPKDARAHLMPAGPPRQRVPLSTKTEPIWLGILDHPELAMLPRWAEAGRLGCAFTMPMRARIVIAPMVEVLQCSGAVEA